MRSTNRFKYDTSHDVYNDSSLSKRRESKMVQKDKNYVSQYNEPDLYLAVGPNNDPPRTYDDQIEELREYFKQKIVNAYNSI